MEDSGRLATYINSLYGENGEFLEEIERMALEAGVPVIKKEIQSLIRILLEIKAPKNILEVGTATGFSAIFMCTYAPDGASITTIEKYNKRIPIAEENFRRAGFEDRITLLEGDAEVLLKTLEGPYDFIFMDAAKGQYINFLPEVLRLLGPCGILLSDNVLQGGDVIESRFAVERRDRTIHARMREYLYEITHRKDLVTSVLTVGDGAALSVKKEQT